MASAIEWNCRSRYRERPTERSCGPAPMKPAGRASFQLGDVAEESQAQDHAHRRVRQPGSPGTTCPYCNALCPWESADSFLIDLGVRQGLWCSLSVASSPSPNELRLRTVLGRAQRRAERLDETRIGDTVIAILTGVRWDSFESLRSGMVRPFSPDRVAARGPCGRSRAAASRDAQ